MKNFVNAKNLVIAFNNYLETLPKPSNDSEAKEQATLKEQIEQNIKYFTEQNASKKNKKIINKKM